MHHLLDLSVTMPSHSWTDKNRHCKVQLNYVDILVDRFLIISLCFCFISRSRELEPLSFREQLSAIKEFENHVNIARAQLRYLVSHCHQFSLFITFFSSPHFIEHIAEWQLVQRTDFTGIFQLETEF